MNGCSMVETNGAYRLDDFSGDWLPETLFR
jgi:hypothetical protein